MKTYFIASDIHSFFSEWRNALHRKGFKEDDPNHIIVVCGDLFDRGFETISCFHFVEKMAALNRLIYIRGNHEDLLYDCVRDIRKRYSIGSHHISNGTIRTIAEFVRVSDYDILSGTFDWNRFEEELDRVLDFIEINAQDYHELGNYILVHGWVPSIEDKEGYESISENWRDGDWRDARWSNGMEYQRYGLIVPEKTVVCGHWHTSYGWAKKYPDKYKEWETPANFNIFKDDGIIALDGCVAATKMVNILVLQENENGEITEV